MKPSAILELRAKEHENKYPKATVTEMLEKRNGAYLNQVAIDYYGKKITYEELFENNDRFNRAFANVGIEKGDYVGIGSGTIPEAIYSFYGLNKLGAYLHPLVPTLSKQELISILESNKAKLAITLDSLYFRYGDAIKEVNVHNKVKMSANRSLPTGLKQLKTIRDILKGETYKSIPEDYMTLNQFLKQGKNHPVVSTPWEEGKIAAVTSSSGTTAVNKGTLLTDYGFNAMVYNYMEALPELRRGQTFHSCIPLLYSTGLSNSVNLPLQLGLTTILEPIYDKDAYPERFMKVKPNLSIVPVPHAKALLNYLREVYKENSGKKDMLSFMDVFSVGGSHMPKPWEEELEFYFEHFGAPIAVGKGYGLSEHNSALTISSTEKMLGSAGKVLPGVILGIFDPITGEELDFGQEGQIRAISPSDMLGYFNDPKATEEYFMYDETGKRWGKTGDIGRLELIDGEVWLFYAGREREVITINSKDILLPKIQEKIFECDLVDDCEVVTMDRDGEEVPIAHIALKNKNGSEKEVLSNLKEIFVDNEIYEPLAYKIHDEIPVLMSGKPDKLKLASEKTGYLNYSNENVISVDFSPKILKKTIN